MLFRNAPVFLLKAHQSHLLKKDTKQGRFGIIIFSRFIFKRMTRRYCTFIYIVLTTLQSKLFQLGFAMCIESCLFYHFWEINFTHFHPALFKYRKCITMMEKLFETEQKSNVYRSKYSSL